MSYCRWSSMDFSCDIYAYVAADGYTIHVATGRLMGPMPEYPLARFMALQMNIAEYRRRDDKWRLAFDTTVSVPIGLPADGMTFVLPSLELFRDKLLELREMGYLFPDEVLKVIDLEMEVDHAS